MIGKVSNNLFFAQGYYTNKKTKKDPILEYLESITLSESITKKEANGESLSQKEREFKNNNVVVKNPETILLNMMDSRDKNNKITSINTIYEVNKDRVVVIEDKDIEILNKLV